LYRQIVGSFLSYQGCASRRFWILARESELDVHQQDRSVVISFFLPPTNFSGPPTNFSGREPRERARNIVAKEGSPWCACQQGQENMQLLSALHAARCCGCGWISNIGRSPHTSDETQHDEQRVLVLLFLRGACSCLYLSNDLSRTRVLRTLNVVRLPPHPSWWTQNEMPIFYP